MNQADILIARVKNRLAEQSILLTGLRGVGKTVLLNEINHRARAAGYSTTSLEVHDETTLGALLAPRLRSVLYELQRLTGFGEKVRRGLAVLRSFISSIKFEIREIEWSVDIQAEKGTADSGDLEIDLPELFVAAGEAALEKGGAIAVFIDEIQYVSRKELGALIMAMHRIQQLRLPVILVGAGLPTLPALAGAAKSYAERLFSFPRIDVLSPEDEAKALQEPARANGASFDPEALAAIHERTHGYPYFVQEWGYQAWNLATSPRMSREVIHAATVAATERLDQNFFRVRFDRLRPGEKAFLRAMAELGAGPYRTSDIAQALGAKITSIGPTRAKLIDNGMVYAPAHGDLAFTVPLFDEFLLRRLPMPPRRHA